MLTYFSRCILFSFLFLTTWVKAMDMQYNKKTEEELALSQEFDLLADWQQIQHQDSPEKREITRIRDVALFHYAEHGYTQDLSNALRAYNSLNINVKDRDGNTPLQLAVKKGNESIIKILLEHNAWLTFSNTDGNTPLHTAILERKSLSLIDLLFTHPDIKLCCNMKNKQGLTPLFLALKRLKSVCCPDKKITKNKETIYDKDNIKLLIFRLLDVGDTTQANISNNKEKMPINLALKIQEQEVIRKLIAAGAIGYNCLDKLSVLQQPPQPLLLTHDCKTMIEEKTKQVLNIPQTTTPGSLNKLTSFFIECREKLDDLFTFVG